MGNDDGFDLFGDEEGVPDENASPRRGMDAQEQDGESSTEDDGAGDASSRHRRRAPMIFLCAVLAIILLVVGVLGYFLKHLTNGLDQICLLYTSPSPRDS